MGTDRVPGLRGPPAVRPRARRPPRAEGARVADARDEPHAVASPWPCVRELLTSRRRGKLHRRSVPPVGCPRAVPHAARGRLRAPPSTPSLPRADAAGPAAARVPTAAAQSASTSAGRGLVGLVRLVGLVQLVGLASYGSVCNISAARGAAGGTTVAGSTSGSSFRLACSATRGEAGCSRAAIPIAISGRWFPRELVDCRPLRSGGHGDVARLASARLWVVLVDRVCSPAPTRVVDTGTAVQDGRRHGKHHSGRVANRACGVRSSHCCRTG